MSFNDCLLQNISSGWAHHEAGSEFYALKYNFFIEVTLTKGAYTLYTLFFIRNTFISNARLNKIC